MPSRVYQDVVELSVSLVEAIAPTDTSDPSYPYPRLEATNRFESRSFRTVVLENDLVGVTLLPDLGGRIFRYFDKRTNTDCLPVPSKLIATSGGARGAEISTGIEWLVDHATRRTALGTVRIEPDETSEGAVWLFEHSNGTGIGFNFRLELPNDRSELIIETRFQNRTLDSVPYNSGLCIHSPGALQSIEDGFAIYDTSRLAGLAITVGTVPMTGQFTSPSGTILSRFSSERILNGRQVDTWSASITPVSGFETAPVISREGSLLLTSELVSIQTTEMTEDHKLLLVTELGKVLEANVNIDPLKGFTSKLPEPCRTAILRSPAKEDVIRFDPDREVLELPAFEPVVRSLNESPNQDEESQRELLDQTFDTSVRHLAYLKLAIRACQSSDWNLADTYLDSVLMYNADDPLTWWLKGAVRRHTGATEEKPEILNAHYLSPFEPILRAEAFLAMPVAEGSDPSLLLEAFDEDPEAFVEVAHLLIESGLLEDASRWLDAALMRNKMAVLHRLYAYILQSNSRMQIDARQHLEEAAKLSNKPPFPWRSTELRALNLLHK